jgi:hypothetical protein
LRIVILADARIQLFVLDAGIHRHADAGILKGRAKKRSAFRRMLPG